MTGQETILHRLHHPGSARHLALVRILVGIYLAILFRSQSIDYLMQLTDPNGYTYLSYLFPKILMNPQLIDVLRTVGLISCVFVAIGLLTRSAVTVLAICFLLVQHYYYRHTGYHDDWLYFNFLLLVLCFSRCADAWSIDSWLRRRLARSPGEAHANPQEYRWPVEVMQTWFCSLYVLAAVAKMFPLENGIKWLGGGTTQQLVLSRMYDSPLYWIFGRPLFDYTQLWPFMLIAIGAVVIEAAVVFPLFTRRYNAGILLLIFALHFGIYVVGVPGFLHIAAVCSVLFIPPEWFPDFGRAPDAMPAATAVPASAGLCRPVS
jgi:MFS family permease